MASLKLKHIYKVYDGGVKAVNDFNMEIEDKEFIVFVGPSGCGKSTTLRMIAGIEDITAGELMIGDEVVNDLEPKDRNIAMVFQNYALYPHMTVRENMAFALRMRKEDKLTEEEIQARVEEAAAKLDIKQFLDRKPRALSGGQRQRVSLGRAIVRSPKVFLLDEPLSNLDAKLRAHMRTEISKLHKQLQTTFIYVTHDQVEAMTMGSRIVVMKFGVIQQIDTPKNLYEYPANKFVAGFIGTPQMNFFEATLKKDGKGKVIIDFAKDSQIKVDEEYFVKVQEKYFDGQTKVTLGIRPEDVHIEEEFVSKNPDTALEANIGIIEALGSQSLLYCELDPEEQSITESATRMVLIVDPKSQYTLDQKVKVALDPSKIHLFDNETEMTIMPRLPKVNVIHGKVVNNKVTLGDKTFDLPKEISLDDNEYIFEIPSNGFYLPQGKDEEDYSKEIYQVSYLPVEEKFKKKAFQDPIQPIAHEEFGVQGIIGDTEFEVKSSEVVGKNKVLGLSFGKETLFAVADKSVEDSKSIKTDIDFKRVCVKTLEGEVVKEALNEYNELPSKMVKEKINKKEFNFGLDVYGKAIYTNDYIQTKLFNAAGRKVFDIDLALDFNPYFVKISQDGFEAEVKEIKDYSKERFAVCMLNDKEINVFLRKEDTVEVGQKVKLIFDIDKVGIVESKRGIRVL